MNEFVVRVRRRLRLAWGLATTQWLFPALTVGVVVLLLIERVWPWVWPSRAAAVASVATVLAIVTAAMIIKISNLVTARAIDNGLGTRDALATALELRDAQPPQPFLDAIHRRADFLVSGRTPAEAVPLPWAPKRLLFAGGFLAAAVALVVVPNHQDAVRKQQGAEKATLARQADELRKEADKTAAQPNGAAAASTLRELANQLAKAGSLDKGQQAIDRAMKDLQAGIPPTALSDKAAAVGLERSVQAAPLPGTKGSAAEQLRAAAQELGALSAEEKAALAERLKGLASAQATGSPEMSQALSDAAAAVAAGDPAAAAAALEKASAAAKDRVAKVRDAAAKSDAARKMGEGKARLASQGAGKSASKAGDGQGKGQGSGSGQGKGAGQGSGQGSGQGQGGSGSGSGGAGTNSAGGQNGQGGAAKPNGSGNNPSVGLKEGDASIFQPTNDNQLIADGNAADGPGQTVGKTAGPNTASGAQVPLSKALPSYQAQATAAADNLAIPPSERNLVKAYFEGLGTP